MSTGRWANPREDRPPTPAETATLAIVRAYLATHNHPPTIREVGALRGVTVNAARQQLDALVAKGYLTKRPGTIRTLTLTAKTTLHLPETG